MRSRLTPINNVLTTALRQIRLLYYRRDIKAAARLSPSLYAPVDKLLEENHRSYWQALGKVDCHWLRFYVNLSAIEDKRYIPNDIYIAIVERRLNDGNYNSLVADKNYLERLFGKENFPLAVLRRMSGVFLDADYRFLEEPMRVLPPIDLIIKPAVDSKGGTDVKKLAFDAGAHHTVTGDKVTADYLCQAYGDNFIVQEVIRQHGFCAGFNPGSVNTFRVYVYRSVRDEGIHVLKTVFRTGIGDSVVDNQVAGGVSCVVNHRGELGNYAVSKKGEAFGAHPASGIPYQGQRVPCIDLIKQLCCDTAARIPSHRVLGFDVALTADDRPTIVEINPMGISLNMMQVDGGPLFGEFTDEVIEYCARHPDKDNMKIIRT